MNRAKLRGLQRNATVVLGDIGNPEGTGVLTDAVSDPDSLVREHPAWALARHRGQGIMFR